MEHDVLLRDADVAIVSSAYAVATVDLARLKEVALERERGVLAKRRNGRLAWQDFGAWTQERYGVNVDEFDAFTLVVAPETGLYVIGQGRVDVSAITGEQRTMGGSLAYAMGDDTWMAVTGAPRQWAFFGSRWSIEAWASERSSGQMGLSETKRDRFAGELSVGGPRVAHGVMDVPAWELAGGQGALGLSSAQVHVRGGDLVFRFTGGEEARGALRGQVRAVADHGESVAGGLRQQTMKVERLDEVAELLVLAHVIDRVVEGHQVKLEGDDVVVVAPGVFDDLDAVLGLMVGSLMLKSVRDDEVVATERAVEARLNQMAGAAADHFTSSGGGGACAFPPSAPPVPAQDTCCASRGGPSDGSGRMCRANLEGWGAPEWAPLRAAAPVGEAQPMTWSTVGRELAPGVHEYVVKARGDGDCDGVRSTYQVRLLGREVEGECVVEVGGVLSRTTRE